MNNSDTAARIRACYEASSSVNDYIRRLYVARLWGAAWGVAEQRYGAMNYAEFLERYSAGEFSSN